MWKRFRGFKRPLNMMSWTGSSTTWDCLIWCPLGRKRCTPLCCLLWLLGGGGKRREGECYLISLNITLHRVQLHQKKSRKETSWSWTRERTFKRKGLRKRIKSVPCSLICKKNVFCHEGLWILLLMRTIATFLASHITATNLCENNK